MFGLIQKQQLGGKARGLRQLRDAGCRVPPFVTLPANWFSPWLENDYSLRPGWENSSNFALVPGMLAAVGINETVLAVRSSALGEDGQEHAHPGMLDSVLAVEPTQLHAAIAQVVKSAGSERVQAYRRQKGLTGRLLPAVVVQQWLEADFSGVLFSTNPLYPHEMLLHLVPGAGEALVQGQKEPAEYAFDKASGKCYWQQLPVGESALDAVLLHELFATAKKLEHQMDMPLDLEFCVVAGDIYWLQMRPITTPPVSQLVLDNANIQESYCGLTSELGFSFARRAYATVYTQTMRAVGLPESKVQAQKEVVNNLLYHHQGRVYYNINNWYRGLQLLPSFRQNKADMERMMGLESPVELVNDRRLPWYQLPGRLPALLLNLGRLLWAFKQLPKQTERFNRQFDSVFNAFYAAQPAAFTEAHCLQWYQLLNKELLHRWEVPIVNDFYVMMQNGRAHRRLAKQGINAPEHWLRERLHQHETLPSLAPLRALQQLAELARKQPQLLEKLLQNTAVDMAALASDFPAFHQALQAYIHLYGDRVMGELKLESHSMRTHPQLVLAYLRPLLQQQVEAPKPNAHAALDSWLEPLRMGIFRREALRLQRTRLFGMYRSLFRRMGELLATKGMLPEAEAIFYWRLEELEAYWEQGSVLTTEALQQRQKQHVEWAQSEPPGRVYLPGRQPHSHAQTAVDFWQGQAAVAGTVAGEVVCIAGPGDLRELRGKILCALRTDPGWTPLFPGCRGVIIERGSSLSHSVIVLRELGIPTIINVPGISASLRTGDRVQLDGQAGTLQRLSE